jgi:signal transduction histidine kinase
LSPNDTSTKSVGALGRASNVVSGSQVKDRTNLGQIAEEQAALRRVATLVAQGAPRRSLFTAVAEQVASVLDAPVVSIVRYETDDTATEFASVSNRGEFFPVGTRWPLAGTNVVAGIRETGRPARIDDYTGLEGTIADAVRRAGIHSTVGSPIVVAGRAWGAMIVSSPESAPLPPDTEERLTDFTELVATAIANAEARDELHQLADEQAALLRVATLVAQGAPANDLFATVAEEAGRLVGVDVAGIYRYEPDETATTLAVWGVPDAAELIGTKQGLEGDSAAGVVLRTGRPARLDDYADARGPAVAFAREHGIRASVVVPIVVERRLWGAMIAASRQAGSFAADTESRMEQFTKLVAMAISNTQARSDLAASRARIVAASDEERKRVVRDLHDGAQQRLVHTVVTLKLARRELENDGGGSLALVTEALRHAGEATLELRELAHGILPPVLTRGGLRAGVVALASRMPVPVDIGISGERFPSSVEATAYFIVAEALTNVTKHAHARRVEVNARVTDGALHVQVRDDGVGGARPGGGGLLGLADRLGVLDGNLRVESPRDGGTVIAADIPIR